MSTLDSTTNCYVLDTVSLGYGNGYAVQDASFSIRKGQVVSIVGPNGSGKSTLLRAMGKLLPCAEGAIHLDGRDISAMGWKQFARNVGMLLQTNRAPADIRVKELVYYGRMPQKKWYESRNHEDTRAVEYALYETRLIGYEDKQICQLSGGERQRVWLACALAQHPDVLLLDEPTTYLDVTYQLELLSLIKHLNEKHGITIVMVLHDINQAAHYSDSCVVVNKGNIVASGSVNETLTDEILHAVFNIEVERLQCSDGSIYMVPHHKKAK